MPTETPNHPFNETDQKEMVSRKINIDSLPEEIKEEIFRRETLPTTFNDRNLNEIERRQHLAIEVLGEKGIDPKEFYEK